MAKSLDQLFDFLLQEIALEGEQGITVKDLVQYVKKFYGDPTSSPSSTSSPLPTASPSIDRAFVSRLWYWLSKHNDISVGENHEFNSLSLNEVESQFPGILVGAALDTSPSTAHTEGTASPQNAAVQAEDGPRIYASEELVCYAIAGHGPDPTRIFSSEYTLLCRIAAARYDGILQGTLRQLTGQDKRSVPKRTDSLHAKGYIIKRTVYTGGHKTSRLFLRRFAYSYPTSDAGQAHVIRLRDLASHMFSNLRDNSLLTQDDIALHLGLSSAAQIRVLVQLLRHFIRKTCLRKVKSAFAPGSKAGDLRICFQLLREPTDQDWTTDENVMLDLDTPLDDAVTAAEQDEDGDVQVLDEVPSLEEQVQTGIRTSRSAQRPLWNPDRVLSNILSDFVSSSGDVGITNLKTRQEVTGLFVRRPIESLLVRLSHLALKSQPATVKDIAIVRRHELENGISHYVHRKLSIYHEMVRQGLAEWASIEGGEAFAQQLQKTAHGELSELLQEDQYGMVERAPSKDQMQDGAIALEDLINSVHAATYTVRNGDLHLKETSTGQPCLSNMMHQPQPRSRMDLGPSLFAPKRQRTATGTSRSSKSGMNNRQGRHRKWTEGTRDFWSEIFFAIRLSQDPTFPKNGTGYMNNPAAVQVFESRPSAMDSFILQSLRDQLPVPFQAQDISQRWIDEMQAFSHRSCQGIFFSPTGMRGCKRPPVKSKLMVVRSHRLNELDYTDRRSPPAVLLISSSVAHTYRYHRFSRWWNTISDARLAEITLPLMDSRSDPEPPQLQSITRREVSRPTPPVTPAPSSKQAPIRGLFREHVPVSASKPPTTVKYSSVQFRTLTNPIDDGSDTDATVTDREVVRREAQARRRRTQSSTTKQKRSDTAVIDLPATGRSGRRRKPTQKAIEIAQIHTPDPNSNISSPLPEEANKSGNLVGTIESSTTTPPRSAIIPTPDSSRHGSPYTASPGRGGTKRKSTIASNDIRFDPRNTDTGIVLPPEGREDPLRTHVVVLRISSGKLAQVVSSSAIAQSQQHDPSTTVNVADQDIPEPEISVVLAASDRHEATDTSSQQISPESSTVQVEAPLDGLEQSAAQVEGLNNVHPEAQEVEAMLTDQPVNSVEVLDDLETPEAAYPYEQNSRATSVSVASSYGNETTPTVTNKNGATAKRRTHRVVKDDVAVSPNKIRSPFKAIASKFHESRHATRYYRKFIMELVQMCNGVVPHQPSTLKRVMQPKCIEANIDPNANIKNMKKQVDQLVRTNQLKIMGFAFQRNGMSYTKKILALPHIQGTDPQFIEMRNKIAALPFEDDYVPPEFQAESMRQPSSAGRHDFSDEGSSGQDTIPTPKRKRKDPTSTSDRRRSTKPAASRLSFTPEPQAPPPNTGFLTLKIPKEKLERLNIGPAFTSHYFRLPAVPLQFEADADKVASATAAPTPLSQRRSGTRIPRNTQFNSGTRKIQWRTPKLTPLPRTVKAILAQERPKQGDDSTIASVSAEEAFQTEVDLVSSWEQRKWNDLQEPKPGEWIFIRHTVPRGEFLPILLNEGCSFRSIHFNQNGEEIESEAPPVESWQVFVDALIKTTTKRSKTAAYLQQRKRKFDEIDGQDGDIDVSDYEEGAARQRSVRVIGEHKKRKVAKEKKVQKQHKPGLEVRGIGMRYLSTEQIHRLSVAIVVVRTLFGGLERHLDLNLLARIYTDEPLTILRERWKVIRARCMSDIDTLSQVFQVKYLDALADEKVPSVNFDDLDSTDWAGILQWAILNVNKEGGKDLEYEIPPTRDELFELNDLEVEESAPMRNLYTQTVVYAGPSREDAWCSVVFGDTPTAGMSIKSDRVMPKFPHEDEEQDILVTRARSWVLAAILTPSQSFDPARAHAKLLKLAGTKIKCEKLIDSALKKLQSDKFVVRANNTDAEIMLDGRTYSGTHGWKICSKFFDRLDSQRFISPTMLKQAARFKIDVIDRAFAQQGTLSIEKDADIQDGDMVAVLNLLSMGMIRIKPGSDVPASRYGVDWERQEYKTKSMDKNLLAFTSTLEPSPSYIFADPLIRERQTVAIPRGGLDQEDGLGLIPVWFDIHHDFRPEIWEMVMGAVVGLVSVRPGVDHVEIMRTLGWALPSRDVDMILQFLFDCGCVQRVYTGWETTEWWWLAIGYGNGNGVTWNIGNGM